MPATFPVRFPGMVGGIFRRGSRNDLGIPWECARRVGALAASLLRRPPDRAHVPEAAGSLRVRLLAAVLATSAPLGDRVGDRVAPARAEARAHVGDGVAEAVADGAALAVLLLVDPHARRRAREPLPALVEPDHLARLRVAEAPGPVTRSQVVARQGGHRRELHPPPPPAARRACRDGRGLPLDLAALVDGNSIHHRRRRRSLAEKIEHLGGFGDADVGDEAPAWPPKPKRFKAKYTKDELKTIAWAMDTDTSIGPMTERVREWERQMSDSPGWMATFGVYTGFGRTEMLSDRLRAEAQHLKDPLWGQANNGDGDGFRARVYGGGASLSTPEGLAYFAANSIAPKVQHVADMMTTWGDRALYRKGQTPTELIERLKTHAAERPYTMSEDLLSALYSFHGFGDAFKQRHHDDKPYPSAPIVGQGSYKRPVDVNDIIADHDQRTQDEHTKRLQRQQEYVDACTELSTLLDAMESTGIEATIHSFVRRLDRGKLVHRLTSRGHVYQLEGYAPGWNIIGHAGKDRKDAFRGFVQAVRGVADSADRYDPANPDTFYRLGKALADRGMLLAGTVARIGG